MARTSRPLPTSQGVATFLGVSQEKESVHARGRH